jgi:hypothetical protein
MYSGSDHWPIALQYRGEIKFEAIRRKKRLYKDANCVEIRIAVGSQLGDGRFIKAITDVDTFEWAAGIFTNSINAILEEHVPRAKESLYAKW